MAGMTGATRRSNAEKGAIDRREEARYGRVVDQDSKLVGGGRVGFWTCNTVDELHREGDRLRVGDEVSEAVGQNSFSSARPGICPADPIRHEGDGSVRDDIPEGVGRRGDRWLVHESTLRKDGRRFRRWRAPRMCRSGYRPR